ncbi:MAG: outer membrane protein transport protein [Bacteroidetes bacterium]|nr:outer membrane protein transport protein [Bacteroidota bacterium]
MTSIPALTYICLHTLNYEAMDEMEFAILTFFGEAGGFQVNTQGQKAISMGGSVSGWAMDASVCYFNPGGLTALKSNFLNAGVSFLLPKSTFLGSTGSSESMSSQLYTPFYVYGNYVINQKISVGLSVNTPLGLGTKWEDDWSGRFISRRPDSIPFSFSRQLQ